MVLVSCRRFLTVTDNYDEENFFTMENGARVATPLLLVLAVIELSDIVFAVDSIPAVSILPPHGIICKSDYTAFDESSAWHITVAELGAHSTLSCTSTAAATVSCIGANSITQSLLQDHEDLSTTSRSHTFSLSSFCQDAGRSTGHRTGLGPSCSMEALLLSIAK